MRNITFSGIISKLDHFKDLNIETIHLTPIFDSNFRDMGYDIKDYTKISPQFGTMDDFDQLIEEMNKRGKLRHFLSHIFHLDQLTFP